MYCENCGCKIPEDAMFCPNCSHSLRHYRYSKITLFFYSIRDKISGFPERYAGWSGGRKAMFLLALIVVIFIIVDAGALAAILHMENSLLESQNDVHQEPDEDYGIAEDSSSDESYGEDDSSSDASTVEATPSTQEDTSDYSTSQDSSAGYGGTASGGSYVASSKSDKFHYPSCRYVGTIKSGNLISFSSRDDALSSGYSPCKVCSP